MNKMVEKHAGSIKWAGTLIIPTVLISFWLGVGSLFGQSDPSSIPAVNQPEAVLPTIGTSLTAGGVFYLVMAFLQKTIDRYELEKKDIHAQWQKLLDTAAVKADNIVALAYRDRDTWASKYQEIVADVMDDTKSLRLGQINAPKPRRQS